MFKDVFKIVYISLDFPKAVRLLRLTLLKHHTGSSLKLYYFMVWSFVNPQKLHYQSLNLEVVIEGTINSRVRNSSQF